MVEKDRASQFMAWLNKEYDHVRILILGKEEMATLNEEISLVSAKESRRGVMLEPRTIDNSANCD